MFTRQALLDEILYRLSIMETCLKWHSGRGHNDACKTAEDVMARFLGALCGWNLVNLNTLRPNYPAADLGDPALRLAVQVTVNGTAEKIKETHDKAQAHQLSKDFDRLILLFLLPKAPAMPRTAKTFDPAGPPALELWARPEINKALDQLTTTEALQAVLEVLQKEMSGIEAILTPLSQEDPSTILRLLREGLPQVRAATAGRLQITPPRAVIPAASQLFGRENDLTMLLELLKTHPRLAITGPGGLGKTALCAELVRRVEAEPWGAALTAGGLYAHDFYKEPSLAAFVAGILNQAELPCENSSQQPALAALALRQPGVMLYLEGAEKLASVDPLLEIAGPHTRILLTTRDPRQAAQFEAYPLEPLASADAAAAIYHYASRKSRPKRGGPWLCGADSAGWLLLARDLGGHALACRVAGELCAMHTLDPATLHEELGEQGLQTLVRGSDSKHNLHILFRQSALAVQAISPGSPSPALTAWHCLTLGGTSPVPFSLLQAFGVLDQKDLEPLLELGLAGSISVASEEDGAREPAYYLTHVLLGEWARTGLAEFGRPAPVLLEPAMEWGKELLNRVLHHARVPGGEVRYLAVAPVAEGLLREVEFLPGFKPEALYHFFYLVGRMHHLHARHLAAERIFRRGLDRMELTVGMNEPIAASALNNLAQLLRDTNRLAEAEPLMRRVVEIFEKSPGTTNSDISISLNNLAQLLQDTNRVKEAESLLIKALAIDEAFFGQDHPNLTLRLNNLAALFLATKRFAEAEPLMRRVLAIDEAVFDRNHLTVARDLNNLAMLLHDTNRLAEAEELVRRALSIDEASFGKEHPNVALRLNNLVLLLQALNKLAEAEPLMRRALAIDEATFGKDHPTVAVRLNNLAQLLQDTNRMAEAELLTRRALAIDEASFGNGHPTVAIRLNNLAQLLQATNRLPEAEQLMRRALAIDEASLGKLHPTLAIDLNNLAQLLQTTNRLAEAEPLMRRVVEIFQKFFGKEHPNLATSFNNLARLLLVTNRQEEAEPLFRQALAIHETSLGSEHPNVAIDLTNLAMLLLTTNRMVEAEPLMQRALQIFANVTATTGHPHPQLMTAANNYVGLLMQAGNIKEIAIAKVVAILAPVRDILGNSQKG